MFRRRLFRVRSPGRGAAAAGGRTRSGRCGGSNYIGRFLGHGLKHVQQLCLAVLFFEGAAWREVGTLRRAVGLLAVLFSPQSVSHVS